MVHMKYVYWRLEVISEFIVILGLALSEGVQAVLICSEEIAYGESLLWVRRGSGCNAPH